MKVQNINVTQYKNMTQYKNISVKESDIFKFEDSEQKVDKSKYKDYNYNKNIEGQGKKDSDSNDESNDNQDKVTSEIVVNPSGMRTLLMLRNSKVFSSVDLGMLNNVINEQTKGEVSSEILAEPFNLESIK